MESKIKEERMKLCGVNVGDTIRIVEMADDSGIDKVAPLYAGMEGEVTLIDDEGQLHGTWGGLAVIPGFDSSVIIRRKIDPFVGEDEIGGAPSPSRQRRAANNISGR